ncbi:MAG: M56 family metallopeptidase [Lachnospiraceae bacterium]|nr:M56 family metallopeptidase [Lachnospiraceae bacterium]
MTLGFLAESLFATVLQLSFYGTVGCGVILICALVNYARAPRWISMVLWALVALRLVIPFHFSSAVSLFQFRNIGNLSAQIDRTLVSGEAYSGDYQTALEGSAEFEQAVAAGSPVSANADGGRMAYYYARENGRIEPAKTKYASLLTIGSRVWLAGVALLWIWAAVSYVRLTYKLRFSMLLCSGVYETDVVSSPCVVGIIRPRIYLVPDLTDQQKIHILLHERMHIRYLDHIWKVVSFLVISIHWFNPFLWFMYRLFQGELEKACDERVLARLGEDKKEDYSQSLLALAAGRDWKRKNQKRKLPTPIAFGEDNIKGRIKRILAYRKPLATVSVFVVILAVIGCGIFLTTAEATENAPISDLAADSNVLPADSGDGTPETLPEQSAETEPASIFSDEETAPDEGAGPDLTEVYEELADNGVTYQARWDGIYRIREDGREEQLYDIFAGTEPQMEIFEGKLYFRTDASYEDGALDWSNTAIRWIDLETGAIGDLSFLQENRSISFFTIYNGLAVIHYDSSDDSDTRMLYIDEDTSLNGKHITQLTESEKQQLGQSVTQSVLQNPGQLVNISNRTRNQNIACLDMDGDGISEEIILEPSREPRNMVSSRSLYDPLFYFHLQVGRADLETWGDNLANTLWAISLDGQNILLVLYEDGPSGDPYTHLYRYENNQLLEAGGFADDIRLCEISPEGVITGAIRQDVVQTDWITMRWQLGPGGMLEEIPQEFYEFQNGNWVDLVENLPLHPSIGSAETFTIPSSQSLRFLQTSADWNWVLIETSDGQQGWLQIEHFEVTDLQKNVMDVFSGLHMAG